MEKANLMDEENVKKLKEKYNELVKAFGSNTISLHLTEISGNIAIAASVDKLTEKVTELIEVLKQRG